MEYCDKCGYVKQQCECEKPKTNAQKIRSMTDEELADWIYGIDEFWDDGECKKYINGVTLHDGKEDILEWLQSEAE